MSVNLSAPELCSAGIVQIVQRSLHNSAMDIGIALDDFGTGYAGLDYLQTLPFTTIKIDRTFVAHMHASERSFQIIKSALALSQLLGISAVAEGIEDAATGALLASMGCEFGQGYHYARPRPLHELLARA